MYLLECNDKVLSLSDNFLSGEIFTTKTKTRRVVPSANSSESFERFRKFSKPNSEECN